MIRIIFLIDVVVQLMLLIGFFLLWTRGSSGGVEGAVFEGYLGLGALDSFFFI